MSKFNGRRKYRHKHKWPKTRPVLYDQPVDPVSFRAGVLGILGWLAVLFMIASHYA